MNWKMAKIQGRLAVCGAMLLLLSAPAVHAAISGINGPTFNLTAGTTHISTPDGNSILVWGYADAGGAIGPQYPGPTLIVNPTAFPVTITVKLTNNLDEPVSIVFPGQTVTVDSLDKGTPGLVTREAQPGGTVSYSVVITQPGTYLYHSGTHQDLQVEMGLFGALIVRPANFETMNPKQAYGHANTAYDREFLFLLSEMDPAIHAMVQLGRKKEVDTSAIHLVNWFINGRSAPDTMAPAGAGAPFLPSQPYNCMPLAKPGERVLLRMIGGNKDLHPFHTHGNNFRLIAQDGVLLESAPGNGTDLAVSNFTQRVAPGETYDALFTWTGQGLDWDIYGPIDTTCTDANNDGLDDTTGLFCHDATCNPDANGLDVATREYCPDHGKAIPVALPNNLELTFGPQWSGSPFLGTLGSLPPGQGTGNLEGGYFFMWHSHNERELTNNDIFPGGLLTMFMIVPPSATIMEGP